MIINKSSSIILSFIAALLIVISLSGCFSHWQGDMAKIVISFGGADRAVYDPGASATHQKLDHWIVLTGETETREIPFKGNTFEAYVTPGKWNIKVDSYLDGEIYATGSKDIIVKLGQNNETIQMYEAYLVRFDSNDGNGTVQSIVVKAGKSIKLPGGSGFSRPGYDFEGWNTEANGAGRNYPAGFEYTPEGNITFYAVWVNASLTTFTVRFDSNGGSGTVQSMTVNAGGFITLPDGDELSQTGYDFECWNTNDKGTGDNFAAGSFYWPTASITLYAKWELIDIPGDTLAAKLSWLSTNAVEDGDYIFTVNEDESLAPQTLFYNGKKITITLKGDTQERNVSPSGMGSLFTIESGVTLILDNNITLKGHAQNDSSLIMIYEGGTLEMNAGSKITGNTANFGGAVNVVGTFIMNAGSEITGNTAQLGGGVIVGEKGFFTMKGGLITKNISFYDGFGHGGGVYNYGTFIMEDGEISYNDGDGVNTQSGGTFTMKDGEISHNTNTRPTGGGVTVAGKGSIFNMNGGTISYNTTVNSFGGGVLVLHATFTMTDGTISNNEAQLGGGVYLIGSTDQEGNKLNATFTMEGGQINNNTATGDRGGGVHVVGETFIMNGGKIYNNTANSGGGVSVMDGIFNKAGKETGGTIYENNTGPNGQGKSVFATGINFSIKRDGEVIPTEELSFNGTTDPPTFSGVWDN